MLPKLKAETHETKQKKRILTHNAQKKVLISNEICTRAHHLFSSFCMHLCTYYRALSMRICIYKLEDEDLACIRYHMCISIEIDRKLESEKFSSHHRISTNIEW